jgi:uncharacterized protein with HEPN domain
MKENRDKIYLERILESIDAIEVYLSGFVYSSFEKDKKTYDAALMQFINIGEMVARLSDEFKENHYEFSWHQIVGMRNQIAHGYFEVEAEDIWKTAEQDLPKLKDQIKKLI